MNFINKYKKYKIKYLKLKYQLGGAVTSGSAGGSVTVDKIEATKIQEDKPICVNSLNFDNSRMIQNCNLCWNNTIIYLFYSIPEFRIAILNLEKINNTNKSINSIPEQLDINLLLVYLKKLFNLMDKSNTYSPEIVNDIFIL